MTDFRVGCGYDSHRFEAGRPLRLSGVTIPDSPGLKGHSDADALLHAVIDALLGAAALGDIGSHFPDTDERWRGADSAELLAAVVAEVRSAHWQLGNVDVTVICERPRLAPHLPAMRRHLAELLGLEEARVSIKPKTNEGMDAVGNGLGLAVYAVAALIRD